ncbi:unnamed protein product [Dracunculus medinensis]|uniref:Protein phosphatase inhibitor n=1 Tax=Dracunculus medinensis TaxID=318479 RepID=A0A0N4U5E9_DRAME|nr:unnamed protein product [Dracunculus medinensis]
MEDHIEESLSEKIRRMSRTNKWEEFDSEDSGNRKIWKCQPRTRSEKPPCPKSGSDIETRGKTAQSDSLVGPKNYVSYHDPEQSAHCITVIKVQTNDIGTCGVLHQQKPNLSVHFIGPFTQFRANQSRNSQLENAEAVHFTEDRLQYSLEEEEKPFSATFFPPSGLVN